MIGYKLAKPSMFRDMARLGWSQFLPFITTVLGVVFTDLLKGIGIGMAVAIVLILRNSYKNSHFMHRERNGNGDHKVKLTLAEEVVFLNKGSIKKELSSVPAGAEVTIDMSKSVSVDYDVLEIIEDFQKQAHTRDIDVTLITYGKQKKANNSNGKKEVEKVTFQN